MDPTQRARLIKHDSKRISQLAGKVFDARSSTRGKIIESYRLSVVAHPPEKLLGSILDPSADIQPGFKPYNGTLSTGLQLHGLLAAETANSVVLKLADDREVIRIVARRAFGGKINTDLRRWRTSGPL